MFAGHPIPVLFNDSSILAVDKPSGLLTIPDGYDPHLPYAQGLLEEQFGRLYPVHRLDRETSGVLIFARTPAAHKNLNEQFAARKIQKSYLLLSAGYLSTVHFIVDAPLTVDGDRRHRTIAGSSRGKAASTDFFVLRTFSEGLHLLEARPHTGYTHQIRAHLTFHGCWLLNDPLYFPWLDVAGGEPRKPSLPGWMKALAAENPLRRLALHASALDFRHPDTAAPCSVSAPLSEDFRSSLAFLDSKPSE